MKILRVAVATVGAGALVSSVFTNALASQSHPAELKSTTHKTYGINGNLKVTGVLRVNKNNSVYGRLYAHGGEQVWNRLLIHTGGVVVSSGGVQTDTLTVAQAATLQGSLTVGGNLQAAAISGSTLSLTGAATVGGKLTSNGVDAGAGGLTTSGAVSTGALTATSIVTNGALQAGTLTAGGLTVQGNVDLSRASITGTIDFSHATVTGINLGGIGSNFSSLTVGAAGSTTSPLTISENNQTATLGVNSSGQLVTPGLSTTSNLAVAGNGSLTGNLTVAGSGGVTTSVVTAPTPTGGTLGALTLQGNGISLAGHTTLVAGNDLILGSTTTGTATASHILANGNGDVAGSVQITTTTGQSTGTESTVSKTFTRAYAATPIVVVTPIQDPAGGNGSVPPRYWVTATQSGFTLHYIPGTAVATGYSVTFNYHVIGS